MIEVVGNGTYGQVYKVKIFVLFTRLVISQGSSWREVWEKLSPKIVPLLPELEKVIHRIYRKNTQKKLSLLLNITENGQNFSMFQMCRIIPV